MIDRLTWRIGFIAASILAAIGWAGFTYQTIVLDGVRLLFIHIEGIRPERDRLRIDLDRVEEATKIADKKAREAKAEAEAEYRKKAEETDAKFEAALDSANARADAYARRMRVKAPGGSPGGTPAAPGSDSAQGVDRSGEDAELVAVTREDFDILNENTLRLQVAHEWALGLNQR